MGGWRFWGLVLLAYGATAMVLVRAGAPSAYLLAGVLAGSTVALTTSDTRGLPQPVEQLGMAIVGVLAGGQINAGVLRVLVDRPVAVIGCVLATLIVSMVFGQILRLSPEISPVTALFASIAGGASGVTAVVHEIGGDDAVVMAIQYLRVVAVIVAVPLAAQAFEPSHAGPASVASPPTLWGGLTYTVVCLCLGLLLARLITFSASRLILPLLVAVAFSVADVFDATTVPPMIVAAGFASIGLMVGLAMTRSTLRVILRVLPLALAQLVLALGACVLIGLVLARVTGMSDMDAYLASTPGGLPAVTAIAVSSGASVGVVVTVQLVRVFLALAMAAVLGEWFVRRGLRPAGDGRS